MTWFPLKTRSHFSLQMGLSKPDQIVKAIDKLGYAGSAIVDIGNLAGCPGFQKAMTDTKKGKREKKKAILGTQFYISRDDATIKDNNDICGSVCVLAKNAEGWKHLIQASSMSYKPEVMLKKPRLDIERLANYAHGDFIVYAGAVGSTLANLIFTDPDVAYKVKTEEECKSLARADWPFRLEVEIKKYQELFGTENVFLEIELVDPTPAAKLLAKAMRFVAKKTGARCIAVANSFYPHKQDASDQRILLCSAQETTMRDINERIDTIDVLTSRFFTSNNYHIPTLDEMKALHTEEELANTLVVAGMCEDFSLGDKPRFPKFEAAEGVSQDDILKQHCAIGWNKLIKPKIDRDKKLQAVYAERIKKELDVFITAGLSSYFLIVEEYIKWANENRIRTGIGRGSGAGCLVSYLLGITKVDPIEYELLFERFYNAGRNSPGHIALPDIDSDFEIYRREEVIQHIRELYGENRVCQMSTFSRLQGRGALKDVLRAHERCSYEEMNAITEFIPDEAEISDQLQVMREETGEASIIRWALENNGSDLKSWCFINEQGELDGPLSLDFAQAIRLEGTKRNMGKHASGLIICSDILAEIVPMIWDKGSSQMIVGVDMRDAEAMGLVKFDILGTAVLDKISMAERIIRGEQ